MRDDAPILPAASRPSRQPLRSLTRWLLATAGCVCVAIGVIGIVVPGLPTTVFLLLASWAFTRSCPWLEERLLGGRLGASVRRFRATRAMPLRAKAMAIAAMWIGILFGSVGVGRGVAGVPGVVLLLVAGMIGTYVVAWHVRTLRDDGKFDRNAQRVDATRAAPEAT